MTYHTFDIRVYYEDTDAGGVVYHANYLNFAERGRTEFLRDLGHTNSALAKDFSMIFVVRHMEIDYHKPAFLDCALQVRSSIESMGRSSFIMNQTIVRPARENELVAEMKVTLVCVDTKTLKPVRLPDGIRDEFSTYVE